MTIGFVIILIMHIRTCEMATLLHFCFITTFQVTSQTLLTQNEIGLPNLTDYKNASNDHRITVDNQAIIPTYKLSGCGKITKWGSDVFDNQTSFTLDLQVWRPSPTVDDSTGTGCYSLVGNNRFTSISAHGGVVVVIPSPQDYIRFQSGDVLGFYVEDVKSSTTSPGIVILTSPSWFTSESVWFASIASTAKTSQNGDCPYSVGSNGVLNTLTRAAPVISISISSAPCPPLPVIINAQTNVKSTVTPTYAPSSSVTVTLFPTPSNTTIYNMINDPTSCITDSTWSNTTVTTISPGVHNTQCKPITTEINNSTLPKKSQGDLNVGLIASSGTVIALFVAAILFIVAFLAVVVCRKAGRVSKSTHGHTVEDNLAYGVTQTVQDSHTPGAMSPAEGVHIYDYPTLSVDIDLTRLRVNEAHGVVYETIAAAAGHGESTYRHPVVEFDDDNIEAKRNEAYAAIADAVMKKNIAYNL